MPVIEIRNLHKRYGGRVAVDDVSFGVEEGEIVGVIGPNGAGKTTTVECVAGLRVPDGGSVSVLGLDPLRDRAAVREVLGVQLQATRLPEKLRVGEAVALFASFYARPADGDALLERWALAEHRRTPYAALSGGQQQRLSIVLALVGDPRVAILDELTTGLDPQARRDTWDAIERIRDSGVTLVLVTHFMDEAQRLCDRIAVIDRGRLAALDTPSALVAALPSGQVLRFRTAGPVDVERVLSALPQVDAVDRQGSRVEVRGSGDLLVAVTTALAAHHVVPVDLRTEQAGLEDAVVALTGRTA
jgi:ABC-2 type transport system ATP-binding protein